MNRRFAKSMLVLAIGLLCWMLVRALQPSRPWAELVNEPQAPVALPPADLALIASSAAPGGLPALSAAVPAPAAAAAPPPASKLPADALGQPVGTNATKAGHNQHAAPTAAVPKPKRKSVDAAAPVAVDGLGRAQLDWDVLATTRIDDQYRPTFAASIEEIDGKTVTLGGFMSPLDEVGAVTVFLLLEFPVGCFYCQTPEPTGIVLVELTAGKQSAIHASLVKVTGTLTLNRDDPEDFLYIVTDAEVSLAD